MVLYLDRASDSSSSSENTLNEDEDEDFHDATQLQGSSREESLTPESFEREEGISTTFPFHLISGCSAAERAISMCGYSQMGTEFGGQRGIGVEGTLAGVVEVGRHLSAFG
jgi:hypothetical protein